MTDGKNKLKVKGWAGLALVATLLMVATGVPSLGAETVRIEPGPVAAFAITAPRQARAGEEVALRIVAKDAAGNVVTDYERTGAGVLLLVHPEQAGEGSGALVEPDRFPASAFRQGILDARVVLKRATPLFVEVRDLGRRVSSRTDQIEVKPGPVANIKIMAPTEARVGEIFEAAIELYDRHGNPVLDFDRTGSELTLAPTLAGARGKFDPPRLSPMLFSYGRAVVKLRYSQSEKTGVAVSAGEIVGRSALINIRAGALHHVVVTLPERKASAGAPFKVTIEVKDENNNTITDFNRSGEALRLQATGGAELMPASVPPTYFTEGVAVVDARYTTAEKIRIQVLDAAGVKRGESTDAIDVAGGRIARLDVVAAEQARAGMPLAVQVFGYDVYGNLIRDFGSQNLRIRMMAADASPIEAPVLTAKEFKDGTALFMMTPFRAGKLVLQAVDEVTGAAGTSKAVEVKAGEVASYQVQAPGAAVAHEPFPVEIIALDRFGNIIIEYSRNGAGVALEKSGAGEITPGAIPPSAFVDGVARVNVTYNVAEPLAISVVQQGGTAKGKSAPVYIANAEPTKFKIAAKREATAGEPCRLEITAVDDYGNAVVGYSGRNSQISLYSEDGTPLAPPLIASAAFQQGVANLDVVFLRTGEIRVVAEEVGGAVVGNSDRIRVLAGRPERLALLVPAEVKAGEAFPVRIEMRDKLDNRLMDYAPPAGSLNLRVVGVGPSGIAASDVEILDLSKLAFREGSAELMVKPRKSGELVLEMRDDKTQMTGRSAAVRVQPGAVHHFRVESLAPSELRAGELMKLKIAALDANENVVTSYGDDGSGVKLRAEAVTASGGRAASSGVLLPSTISGKLFVGGEAVIYASYDKAEPVAFVAERLAPGTLMRPEVVNALLEERIGGRRIAFITNAPATIVSPRRLTESLLEAVIPGAILSSSAPGNLKSIGIVSLVTMAQADNGVRILIHATSAAAMRFVADGNRVLVDVEPVIGNEMLPAPLIVVPQPAVVEPASPRAGTGAMPLLPTIADVNRLLQEDRIDEAQGLVNIMLGARPDDPELLALKRRLETISSIIRRRAPAAYPAGQTSANTAIRPLQESLESVKMPPDMASVEFAVRAGRYNEALRLLDRYIAAYPHDTNAQRMRQRVEQLLRTLQQPAGGR